MPRKGPAPKRPLIQDPVYGSQLVTQLVNKILTDGKKSVAERIVYGALEGCREKTGTDPVVTLKRAMDNVKPALEVKSRRVGGATYQVPMEVSSDRRMTLAIRWILSAARDRSGKCNCRGNQKSVTVAAQERRPHGPRLRHSAPAPRVEAGHRAAVNLAGIEVADVARGSAPGGWLAGRSPWGPRRPA